MDKTLVYRGSGADLATDILGLLSPLELRRFREELALKAQEEPSGDPAPADPCGHCCEPRDMGEDGVCRCACHASTSDLRYRAALGLCVGALKRIRLRVAAWEEQDAKALGEGIRTLAEPQPPAPASPAGRECEVIWRNGEPFGLVANLGREIVSGLYRAEIVRMVEAPAAPEAGAPGTPQPGRICTCLGSCKGAEGLAPGWTCALLPVVPPTQTQEGGSQP